MYPSDRVAFADIQRRLESLTQDFRRPVLLVHGDGHEFKIDKPKIRVPDKPNRAAVGNFTRVETFGQPDHHWLEITVDPTDADVFKFGRRIMSNNAPRL